MSAPSVQASKVASELPPKPVFRRNGKTLARRDALLGYLFIAPQFLGFLAFVVLPVAGVLYYSTLDYNLVTGQPTYIGSENYSTMVDAPGFSQVMRNTAIFSALVVPLRVFLGLGLAVLVNRKLPGVNVFRAIFFLPYVITNVAWAIAWGFLFQVDGGINGFLAMVGVEGPNWLFDSSWALYAIAVVEVLKSTGLAMVLFLAALQGVPSDVIEAGQIDGASPGQSFRFLTLPMIAPTMFMVTLLSLVSSLKTFDFVHLLTRGGPGRSSTLLVYDVFVQAFRLFELGYASAIAVVLFLIILFLTWLQWYSRKRWVFHEQD